MLIRPAQPDDSTTWKHLRDSLWPPPEGGDHAREIARYFADELPTLAEVLLAFDDNGAAIGFIELSFRNYAEGCTSEHVAYVEGWYVEPQHRNKHIGAALIRAAEDWARSQGATELASDTETTNTASIAAHHALGFEEIERIACFRKEL